MSATWLLARRNLLRSRARLTVSIGGVALALTLVLALDAIFEGVSRQLTAYIDRSGADVWVAQSGVRNLHMVASWLPATTTDAVADLEGVALAEPILYTTDSMSAGDERGWAYVIGLTPDATMGGPWDVVEGAGQAGSGEAVIDRRFAQRAGVGIGDRVTLLGREFRIAGLTDGTASLVNSVAFVSFDDFAARRGGEPAVSFVLVRAADGVSPDTLAQVIGSNVDGVTAQSRVAFGLAERKLALDMSGDVISIMNVIGFVVGLAVVALTVYIATLALRREYGSLKAVGASGGYLYRVVLAQAGLSVAAGFLAAVAITAALSLIVPRTGANLELAIAGASLTKVGIVAAVIAALAALLPIRQIANLDPALVAREGV
ncbi:MAG TPA: ABC transporter permease [Candidatus Limnocylindrales bacterium]|nr:ABC transporter permease [Candidatus Limnocylindrales bacterium]